MATVIDITTKIKQEPAFIKIGDQSFEVDKSKNTMIEVMAKLNEEDSIENLDIAIGKMLGKDGKKAIDGMKLDFKAYQTVFIAVMACAMDLTFEEAEARFHKAESII